MFYKYAPYLIYKALWGDRKKFGNSIDYNDIEFVNWNDKYLKFYNFTQKGKIGKIVNQFGFQILRKVNFENKVVAEIGPGQISHLEYMVGCPKKYILIDRDIRFLKLSTKILKENNIKNIQSILIDSHNIPLPTESVDIFITFHQLEHVEKLSEHLQEIYRVLRKDGILIGAVPTEGGVAWGLGRYLTSRRTARKMNINYDKIICWEHPNFVDRIKGELSKLFSSIIEVKKPFPQLPMDLNLSYSFVLKKELDMSA